MIGKTWLLMRTNLNVKEVCADDRREVDGVVNPVIYDMREVVNPVI